MDNLNIKSEEQQIKDAAIASTPTIGAQYLTEINQAADASALPRPILYGFLEHKSGFDVQRQSTEDSVGLSGLPLQTIKDYAPEAESYGLDTDEDPLDRADSEVRTQARVAAQLLSNSYGNTSVMDNGQINDNVLRDTYEGVMRTAYGADYQAQDEDVNGFISAVKNYVNSGKEPEFKNADVVMKRNYDANYNTLLNEEDEAKFNNWFADAKSKGLIHPDDNGADYDWRGYWKDNQGELQGNYEAHFTDLYKKPNHATITKGSIFYQQGYITDDDIGEFVDQSKVPELDKKGIPYIIEPDTGAIYVQPKSRRNKEGVTGGAAPIDFGSTQVQGVPLGSIEMDAPEETGLYNFFGKISRGFANKLAKWNRKNQLNREVEAHPSRYFDNTSKYNQNSAIYNPATGTYVLYGELKKEMRKAFRNSPVEATTSAMVDEGVGTKEISEYVYTMEDYNKAVAEEAAAEEIEEKRAAKEEASAAMYGLVTAYQASRGFMPNLLPETSKQDIISSMNRAALSPDDVEVVNNFVDTFRSQVVDSADGEVDALYRAQSLKWDSSKAEDKKQLDDATAAALVLAARFMYNKDDRVGRIFLESAIMSGKKEEDPFANMEEKEKAREIGKITSELDVLNNMNFSSRLQGSVTIHPTEALVTAIATASARDKAHAKLGIETEDTDIINKIKEMYVTDKNTNLYFTRGQLPEQYMNTQTLRALDSYIKRKAIVAAKKGMLDIYDKSLTPAQWNVISQRLGISATTAQATEAEQVQIRRAALRKYITQNRNEVLLPYTNGLSFSVALKLKDDIVPLSIDGQDPYGQPEKQPLSFPALEAVKDIAKSSKRLEDMFIKYGKVIDFSKVPADVKSKDLENIIKVADISPATLHHFNKQGITDEQAISARKKYIDTILDGYVQLAKEVSKYDPGAQYISPEDLFSSYVKLIYFNELLHLNRIFTGKISKEDVSKAAQITADSAIREVKVRTTAEDITESISKGITYIMANTIGKLFETVFPEKENIYGD